MFSNLRLGSKVYILLKPSTLKIGTVTDINLPALYMRYVPNLTLDIKVDIEGESTEFKQLPFGLSITFYDNGKTVISDNKESISTEIEAMIKASKEVISSVEYHLEVIDKGEDLLKLLNPEVMQQEIRINNLENKLDNITNLLTKFLNDSSNKE